MKEYTINDQNGIIKIYEATDFEYSNPIDYYSKYFIDRNFSMYKAFLSMNDLPLLGQFDFLYNTAVRDWEEKYQEIMNTPFHPNFMKILHAENKKDQVRLLKNQSIDPNQFMAFLFRAFLDAGFTLSQYTSHYHHNGVDEENLPKLIEVADDEEKTVKVIGETPLTEGQLRQVVEHRKVVVSKFLDNKDNWHCFFLTFKSARGEETQWKNGQPHFHYISSKFGLTREQVVQQLKNRDYNLGNLPHVDLLGYGNQPVK